MADRSQLKYTTGRLNDEAEEPLPRPNDGGIGLSNKSSPGGSQWGSQDDLLTSVGKSSVYVPTNYVPESPPPPPSSYIAPSAGIALNKRQSWGGSMDDLLKLAGAENTRTARLLAQVHGGSQHSVESSNDDRKPRKIVMQDGGPPVLTADQIRDFKGGNTTDPSSPGTSTHSQDGLLSTSKEKYYADYERAREASQQQQQQLGIPRSRRGSKDPIDAEKGMGTLAMTTTGHGGEELVGEDGDSDGAEKPLSRFEQIIEDIFHVRQHGTTIRAEIYCGVVFFMSCMYVVPIIPHQYVKAGFNLRNTATVCSAMSCLACIMSAFLTNLPLCISPPAAVSVFLAAYLRLNKMSPHAGNVATVYTGVGLCIFGIFRPLTKMFYRLVPNCLQVALGLSIGFLVALAGSQDVGLVVKGTITILDMADLFHGDPGPAVGLASICVIGVCIVFKLLGPFIWGMCFGTLLYWGLTGTWPTQVFAMPTTTYDLNMTNIDPQYVGLIFALFYLCGIAVVGLSRAFCDMASLTKEGGAIPRGRFLFLVCGFATIISGLNSGPPIIISPECGVAIKEGAKTGLSTLVCGMLFFVCTFASPLFGEIPAAGTMPMLFMVGVLMMANTKRINWAKIEEALPSFATIFMVPMTFNLLRGAIFGIVIWCILALASGQMYREFEAFFLEIKVAYIAWQRGDNQSLPAMSRHSNKPGEPPQTWVGAFLDSGDMEVPKSHFDFSTMVHTASVVDLAALGTDSADVIPDARTNAVHKNLDAQQQAATSSFIFSGPGQGMPPRENASLVAPRPLRTAAQGITQSPAFTPGVTPSPDMYQQASNGGVGLRINRL